MMRRAISPRLAISTLEIGIGRSNLDGEEILAVLDGLSVLRVDLRDDAVEVRFDLVHQLHCLDDAEHLPLRDTVAYLHEGRRFGVRRAIERPDDGRRDDVQ